MWSFLMVHEEKDADNPTPVRHYRNDGEQGLWFLWER